MEKRAPFSLPPRVNSMNAERVSRSTFGLSEQMPLLSRSGSIGITRSARYTLLPRSNASLSSAVPGKT